MDQNLHEPETDVLRWRRRQKLLAGHLKVRRVVAAQ